MASPQIEKLEVVLVDPADRTAFRAIPAERLIDPAAPGSAGACHLLRVIGEEIGQIGAHVEAIRPMLEIGSWRLICLHVDDVIDAARRLRDARMRLQVECAGNHRTRLDG